MMIEKTNRGFTIIEMAVVLVIIGLVLGGLIAPLNMQMEQRNLAATKSILENAKDALIGYAMTYGRLPCPATAGSNGQEAFAVGGNASNGSCSSFYGFVPAATLGLTGTDNAGFLLDAYGGTAVNRIRYAVTSANASAFTMTSGMRTVTMTTLAPNLFVCASSTGINATNCNTATPLTSIGVPVALYSLGKNAASGGGVGADEAANNNNDPVFVSHPPAPLAAANGEFDDIVTWLSSTVLYSRLVQAGQLP